MELCHMTNPSHLARRWGIAPKTLQNWRCAGKGPPYIKIGGRIMYRWEDIKQYEIAHQHNDLSNRNTL
ncbi:MAG: helix-turn-helix domain-containing protein [Magnetococcales bacterium]|nr:helix-turn-helix domain-containing protein [Magnetococcales bacterium]